MRHYRVFVYWAYVGLLVSLLMQELSNGLNKMIQNKTARQLMYSWHGGQSSAFYAAASSGLVKDWDALVKECESIKDDPYHPEDYGKLTAWINKKRSMQKFDVIVMGTSYSVLPWVGKSF